MGEHVMIRKLTVKEVMRVQKAAQRLQQLNQKIAEKAAKDSEEGVEGETETEEETNEAFSVLQEIIAIGVEGGDELEEEDFHNFPMDELAKLSDEVMQFSGMGGNQGN